MTVFGVHRELWFTRSSERSRWAGSIRLVGHVPPDVRESLLSKGVGELITGQRAIDHRLMKRLPLPSEVSG